MLAWDECKVNLAYGHPSSGGSDHASVSVYKEPIAEGGEWHIFQLKMN